MPLTFHFPAHENFLAQENRPDQENSCTDTPSLVDTFRFDFRTQKYVGHVWPVEYIPLTEKTPSSSEV